MAVTVQRETTLARMGMVAKAGGGDDSALTLRRDASGSAAGVSMVFEREESRVALKYLGQVQQRSSRAGGIFFWGNRRGPFSLGHAESPTPTGQPVWGVCRQMDPRNQGRGLTGRKHVSATLRGESYSPHRAVKEIQLQRLRVTFKTS